MDIYYLNINEFTNSIEKKDLKNFSDGRIFRDENKETEHLCGLFLVKFIAKNIYNLKNTDIEIINKKPYFKSKEMYFNISHSKDISAAAFNMNETGFDIEYMKDRENYQSIMHRYGSFSENPDKAEFYKFWTLHEAKIKLGENVKSCFSQTLEKDYMLTCASDKTLISDFRIKKLVPLREKINLIKEFENPENIQIRSI